jgi:hypothetical protein
MVQTLNYELPEKIECYVHDSILFDDDTLRTVTKGKIVALNLYKNEAATFTVLLHNGSLFDYIPPHLIEFENQINEKMSLKDLVYNNNISETFTVDKYDFIKKSELKGTLFCLFKELNGWVKVKKYILTIDWLYDNDKRHLVILENNNIAFVPNHKILINAKTLVFMPYKKIRKTFSV